jgi:FixJ family two-component response regulator
MYTPSGVVALVDDDESILRALERALVSHGYRVRAFSSAEQYLDEGVAADVSCVVIDLQLGNGRSGLELGEEIARSVHATPIVFMTGSADPALRGRAMDVGCVAFLEKPFPTCALVAAIAKVQRRDC